MWQLGSDVSAFGKIVEICINVASTLSHNTSSPWAERQKTPWDWCIDADLVPSQLKVFYSSAHQFGHQLDQ